MGDRYEADSPERERSRGVPSSPADLTDQELRVMEDRARKMHDLARKKLGPFQAYRIGMWLVFFVTLGLIVVALSLSLVPAKIDWPIILGSGATGSGLLGVLMRLLDRWKGLGMDEAYLTRLERVYDLNLRECNKLPDPQHRIRCRREEIRAYQRSISSIPTGPVQ